MSEEAGEPRKTDDCGDCRMEMPGEPLGTNGHAMALARATILAPELLAANMVSIRSLPLLLEDLDEPREPRRERSSSEDLWLGMTTRRTFSGRSSP